MSAAASPLEQMVVVLARDLADGELGAAGAAALVPMAAIALARDNDLPIIVFSLDEPGGFRGILAGTGTYTLVRG